MNCENEQNAAIALPASPSPTSIRMGIESDPQMPVRRGLVGDSHGRGGGTESRREGACKHLAIAM